MGCLLDCEDEDFFDFVSSLTSECLITFPSGVITGGPKRSYG